MIYFQFNGIDSRNVKGLIVSELPPLTKPAQRIQTLNIDGRDGSIINPLGFASYTKKIKIGLTTSSDINNIIKWLNGSGKLVLSYEPDKYYNATIYEQIDFNKLLRFRTAEITFTVQPFKYSLTDETKTITSGTSAKIANAGNYTAKPTITVAGSGTVVLTLNGNYLCRLDLNENDQITLDSANQEAFDSNGLRNRDMSGNFAVLQQGINTLEWSGNVSFIQIKKYSRWL